MSDGLYGDAIKTLAAVEMRTILEPDGSATLDNPLCGDRVTMAVRLKAESASDIGHEVKGCLLCRAAASVAAEQAVGLDADGAQRLVEAVRAMLKEGGDPPLSHLTAFLPVRPHKSRHNCVLLPFKALAKAMKVG